MQACLDKKEYCMVMCSMYDASQSKLCCIHTVYIFSFLFLFSSSILESTVYNLLAVGLNYIPFVTGMFHVIQFQQACYSKQN